jgi:hypothetical protein
LNDDSVAQAFVVVVGLNDNDGPFLAARAGGMRETGIEDEAALKVDGLLFGKSTRPPRRPEG